VKVASEIRDFSSLVGLVLALATLLTANRAAAFDVIRRSSHPRRRDLDREIAMNAGLAVVTGLLLLAGLPLWIWAVRALHPLAHGGPLRSAFALTWVLLCALVAWQLSLTRRAWRFRPNAS